MTHPTRPFTIPAHLLPDERQPHPCGASTPAGVLVLRCGLRVLHAGPVHADLHRQMAWPEHVAEPEPEQLYTCPRCGAYTPEPSGACGCMRSVRNVTPSTPQLGA